MISPFWATITLEFLAWPCGEVSSACSRSSIVPEPPKIRLEPDGRLHVPAAPPTSFAALHVPPRLNRSELPPMMSFWPPLPKMTLLPPPPSIESAPPRARAPDVLTGSSCRWEPQHSPKNHRTLALPG